MTLNKNMRHRIFYNYLVVMLVALLGASTTAQSNTAVKVALIADKASGLHKSPLVSLLEVKLSQKEGIELLERAEIDKILQEQQLSVAGLLQRHSAVKVGRLLRVDAFLLLSTEADKDQKQNRNKLLRVRLVETAHGLRLLDSFEEPDGAKLEDTVKRITEKVVAAVPKIMLPPGEAIPVGIVDIHRVQLGERYQWLARTLPAMLSARLSKEPRIIMLEREDLKILHDEKLLAEGEDAEFWSSGVLIDGYLQRRRAKDMEMKLWLRQASGKEIAGFTVLVEPNEPSVAIDKAATRIIPKLLNAPPSASWQPKQEAEEFFRQGQLLKSHRRHKNALALLETAHALQPQNVFYTFALYANEWDARSCIGCRTQRFPTEPAYYSDLELAEIISALVRQIRAGYEKGSLSAIDVLYRLGEPLGTEGFVMNYFTNSASVSSDEVRHINRQNRRIWVETMRKALKEKPNWQELVELAWASSDIPEELMANVRKALAKSIMPPEMGGQIKSPDNRYWFCRELLRHPPLTTGSSPVTHLRGTGESVKKLWRQCLDDLTEAGDPLVKFFSSLALAEIHSHRSEGGPAKAKEYRCKAIEILEKELKTPNEPFSDHIKREIREEARRHCMTIVDLEKFCEPLIEKQDAYNLALWDPGWRFNTRSAPGVIRRYFQLLERIAVVLETRKGNREVTEALTKVRDRQAEIRDLFPELTLAQKPAKLPVTMLLSKEDWPEKRKFELPWATFKATLQGHLLWVAFDESYCQKSLVQLAGIDLAEKKLVALWQIHLVCGGRITGMVIGKEASYVSIESVGLVEFPGSLRRGREFLDNSRILTEKDGLPSVTITGMTVVNDKLWVAYGGARKESGLIIYDPKSGHWETILCSTLTGEPPFNAGRPYRLYEFTLGPADTLFFAAVVWETGSRTAPLQWKGLWKIDTNTREPKYVGIFPGKGRAPYSGLIVVSGEEWWFKGICSLIQFDPDSEKAKFILGSTRLLKSWLSTERNLGLKLQCDFFVSESSTGKIPYGPYLFGNLDLSTCAVQGDRLWARLGESQIIIIHKGKGFEEAEVIENNILNGDEVLRFFSTPYGLIAIGEGTVGLIETRNNEK